MKEEEKTMRNLFRKLKELTGFKYTDIARKFNISRQAVDQYIDNHSVSYTNNNKFILISMADLKIKEYESKIQVLEQFKKEVSNYQRNEVSNE